MADIDKRPYYREAWNAGFRLQAWHLNDGATNSNDGRWDDLPQSQDTPPKLECEQHLYRIHPDDNKEALSFMLAIATEKLVKVLEPVT